MRRSYLQSPAHDGKAISGDHLDGGAIIVVVVVYPLLLPKSARVHVAVLLDKFFLSISSTTARLAGSTASGSTHTSPWKPSKLSNRSLVLLDLKSQFFALFPNLFGRARIHARDKRQEQHCIAIA